MNSLFDNAVASIRMGFEDYRQQDDARDVSAVRNLYAGILLLIKEAVLRAAPDADAEVLIAARLRPVPDGEGGARIEQVGQSTIDFRELSARAKDFGIVVDYVAMRSLNKIRNDLEHHFTDQSQTAIRAAISSALPVAVSIFRQLEEDPLDHLADVWDDLLKTKDVYDAELKDAQSTLAGVKWFSQSVDSDDLRCPQCGSAMIAQVDPETTDQVNVDLHCRTCGHHPDLVETIEEMFDRVTGGESYLRAREGQGGGPIHDCPACGRATVHEMDEICAACSEPLDFQHECSFCSESISIEDYLEGLDSGLCSYCAWRMDKLNSE